MKKLLQIFIVLQFFNNNISTAMMLHEQTMRDALQAASYRKSINFLANLQQDNSLSNTEKSYYLPSLHS